MKLNKLLYLSVFINLGFCNAGISFASNKAEEISLKQYTVIGTQDKLSGIPSAATIVSKKTFETFKYKDVGRVLRQVPGITVQEEDGFGLRPNIAIRGGRSSRSSDITLMEDGILSSPASYSSPEAYYFPQMERMQSVEVIKGSGSIKYGPRTTSGVLNMVTKQIPNTKTAEAIAETGSFNSQRYGVYTGNTTENYGLMLNAYHKKTDGFKKVDFKGTDSGYNADDILAKFRVNSSEGADHYQSIEFKYGYYNETSNETYLGLSDADYRKNPYRRYGASQMDQMNVEANQYALTHYYEIDSKNNVTSTLYNNVAKRSWYRLNSVVIGGIRKDISTLFNDQTANSAYINLLNSANTSGNSFIQRNNSREYYSRGFQSALASEFNLGSVKNNLDLGFRIHGDAEDRFQREDKFDLQNGNAVINVTGAPGDGGNRIQSAKAFSTFVQDKISYDKFSITPGLRYENIKLRRQDYGSADPLRIGSASYTSFESDLDVFIPGIGASYDVNDEVKILGGVHKGFSPPGVPANAAQASFTNEEKSTNYEIGTRYNKQNLSAEIFGFLTKYQNLLGRDSFASGGGGTGNTYNGGKVDVEGVEASVAYNAKDILSIADYNIPLSATYTALDAEFKNSFASSFGEWGNVVAGDNLPYVPKNQIYFSAGIDNEKFSFTSSLKYTDKSRSKAGSGIIAENDFIQSNWTVDLAAEYKINKNLALYTNVMNLFDYEYVAARRPAGLRPGMPFAIMFGVKVAAW